MTDERPEKGNGWIEGWPSDTKPVIDNVKVLEMLVNSCYEFNIRVGDEFYRIFKYHPIHNNNNIAWIVHDRHEGFIFGEQTFKNPVEALKALIHKNVVQEVKKAGK